MRRAPSSGQGVWVGSMGLAGALVACAMGSVLLSEPQDDVGSHATGNVSDSSVRAMDSASGSASNDGSSPPIAASLDASGLTGPRSDAAPPTTNPGDAAGCVQAPITLRPADPARAPPPRSTRSIGNDSVLWEEIAALAPERRNREESVDQRRRQVDAKPGSLKHARVVTLEGAPTAQFADASGQVGDDHCHAQNALGVFGVACGNKVVQGRTPRFEVGMEIRAVPIAQRDCRSDDHPFRCCIGHGESARHHNFEH